MLEIVRELDALADARKAKVLSGFFKSGKGEYGEGDVFLGIKVPDTRMVAKRHGTLSLKEIRRLLGSKVHEHRLAALLILVYQYDKADEEKRKEIYDFYMKNAKRVNNWDLVDLSAERIVGPYLMKRDKSPLYKLARSDNIWERRIAILSTFHFIKNGRYSETTKIAGMLLDDKEDLIHKAVGWMLREVGKRGGLAEERAFLDKHSRRMPRTMLRYAIERFGPEERKRYMG
jgi:3-methyladenine DNA glycosylase AlkD